MRIMPKREYFLTWNHSYHRAVFHRRRTVDVLQTNPNAMHQRRLPGDRHVAQHRYPLRKWWMSTEQTRKNLASR
jgi:hypothetical protein